MATFFEKFNEISKDVVYYNYVQGKVAPYADTDVYNQEARVREELNELQRNIELLEREGAMTKERGVAIMDDICDIAVTLSYLVHMKGESALPYHREVHRNTAIDVLNHLKSCRLDAKGLGKFIAITGTLHAYPEILGCKVFDILGAYKSVNGNNLDKFVPETATNLNEIIDATIKLYPADVINVVRKDTLVAFQRESDNKNMKPAGFKGVDLTPFVEVL